jgi:anti-anti-sigma regulatory factor
MMGESITHFTVQNPATVTVRNSVEFARELREICEEHREVVLDLAELAEADLSLVQLVHAARVHLDRAGGSLRLANPAGGTVAALLVRAGFSSQPDDVDFWFHGVRPQRPPLC